MSYGGRWKFHSYQAFIHSRKSIEHLLCSFVPCKPSSQGLDEVFLSLPNFPEQKWETSWVTSPLTGEGGLTFLYGFRSPKEGWGPLETALMSHEPCQGENLREHQPLRGREGRSGRARGWASCLGAGGRKGRIELCYVGTLLHTAHHMNSALHP